MGLVCDVARNGNGLSTRSLDLLDQRVEFGLAASSYNDPSALSRE